MENQSNTSRKIKGTIFILIGAIVFPAISPYIAASSLPINRGLNSSVGSFVLWIIIMIVSYFVCVGLISKGVDIFLENRRKEKPNSYTPSDFFITFLIFLLLFPFSMFIAPAMLTITSSMF